MILIVDDIPENVFSLKTVLEHNNFKVDTAFSGEEALKKILSRTYVLIILDVQMPGIDGFEVAENVRGYNRAKDTAIIFLSANSTDTSLIVKGYQQGAVDYITKPVDTTILLLKVKTIYDLYETRLENNKQQMEIRELYAREKELNETLAKNAAKLLDAQYLARMANWEYLINERELACSAEVYRLLNVNPDDFQLDVSYVFDHIPLEDRAALINFSECLSDCQCFEFVHRFITDEGDVKFFKEYGTVVFKDGLPHMILGTVQDITSEKEKEAEILKANERYELVNLATNDMIWDWDVPHDKIESNNNISNTYGHKKEEVGHSIDWWFNLVHPDDVEQVKDIYLESISNKSRNWNCEYRLRCADGSYKTVFHQSYCLYSSDNKLIRLISAVKDITDLKLAETELIRTEYKLLQTVENINEGFFTCTKDWEVTYWNKHSEEMIGVKKEEIIGKIIWEILPEAKNLKFYELYSECLKNQRPYSFEEYYYPLDKWFKVNVHPSEEGIAVYFEDITIELLKGLELNNALIQAEVLDKATRDIIWEWDLKTNMIRINKNFYRSFGYDSDTVLVNLDWWKGRIHPDDRDLVKESIYSALASESDIWEREYRFADAKGLYHFVRDRAIILRDENNEPYRITGSMNDMQELKEKESRLEEIAYSNSHIIRKPLANIIALINLLEDEHVARKEVIDMMKQSCAELDLAVKQVAKFSQ